jgi:hydroxyacylglutathione hydrolase
MSAKMEILTYPGGLLETNSYAIKNGAGWLVIDAPEGTIQFLKQSGVKPESLILTHGHWDHMWEAAELAEEFSCPIYYHQADDYLCTNPDIMKVYGLPHPITPIHATKFLSEGEIFEHGTWKFQIFHVPGHSLGSICLYESSTHVLFGGDVLFPGAVGRWDLPNGSKETLINGIKKKILPLPDDTIVYPGHGWATTIGHEKKTNPYLI